MAQNVEEEGQDAEQQNLDQKLNVERDMERIVGTAEMAWEKMAVGNKMETEKNKTTAQAEKRTARTRKQMVKMRKQTVKMRKQTVKARKKAVGTQKTSSVNQKTEGESLYQNRRNTRQTDGRTILYTLKKKKLNQEQEQEFVY
jgi:hypothetical protein